MTKFDWVATNSAPEAYPIHLISAELSLADGEGTYIPDRRVVDHGWGRPGATHIVGDEEKALPTVLSAVWFSYLEDTFYSVEVPLPTDVIASLVADGIDSPQRGTSHAYDRFVFGFGPEGEGALWMSAHTNMIDVFRFRGQKADLPWTLVIDNPDIARPDLIRLVLEEALGAEAAQEALRKGFAPGSFARLQQRFDWSLDVSGAKVVSLFKYASLNGEVFHFFDDFSPNVERPANGAPREIQLQWTGLAGQGRSATLLFDADEAIGAFEALAAEGVPMRLHVELSESANAVAVTLEAGDKIFEFERITADVFTRG
ncbi:MAG: DUF2931 family protein [Pseudomonadota bacterium]